MPPTLAADRILHPDRPRLADALDAVQGLPEPAEAWLALATDGVIQGDWVSAPTVRLFDDPAVECVIDPVDPSDPRQRVRVRTTTGRWLVEHYDPRELSERFAMDIPYGRKAARAELRKEIAAARPAPHPSSVAACVALAADPEGVAHAEALAREVIRRWLPEHPVVDLPVIWKVARRDELLGRWQQSPTLLNRYRAVPLDSPEFDAHCKAVQAEIPGLAFWAEWAEAGRRLWPTLPWGSEPNPFEPLVALWAVGYCLHEATDQGITLGCAALEEPI